MDFDDLDDVEDEISREESQSVIAARCAGEFEREVIGWSPSPGSWAQAFGLFYGLRFPCNERTLKWLGPGWLTKAFRAAGSLPVNGDVEVASIVCVRSLGARGVSERLLLEVEYRSVCDSVSTKGLHTKLLVKVPVDSSERLKQLAKQQKAGLDDFGPLPRLEPQDYFAEVNFYRLLESDAPFRTPRFYYGDISDKTSKWLLITEWVPLPGEADDSLHGELRKLFPGDQLPTLNCDEVKKGRQCFLVGAHGKCLAVGRDNGSVLCMSPCRDERAVWTLRQLMKDGCQYHLVSASGMHLACRDGTENSLYLTPDVSGKCVWTIRLAIGERHKCFFRAWHGQYLSSLNDLEQTCFMSFDSGEFEKWRRVPAKPENGADVTIEHLDLRGADYHLCLSLVLKIAAFAGRQKAAAFGDSEFLRSSFPGRNPPLDSCVLEPDETWHGLRGGDFIAKAASAQEFILRVGAKLFPEGTVTAPMMKGFRAMLVTTKANLRLIQWWLHHDKNYVALVPDRVDMDSAYRWHEVGRIQCSVPNDEFGDGSTGLGLRDWEAVTEGPLGLKLWRWLRFADAEVLADRREDILKAFIGAYSRNGGPVLDFEELRIHFMLAGALESVALLDSLPEIYRCWPKSRWNSICGLRDTRLLGQTLGQGSLWLCLKSVVNIALVLSTCDIVDLLRQATPVIFHAVVHQKSRQKLIVARSGADISMVSGATCRKNQGLVCHLDGGFPVVGTGRRQCFKNSDEEWVEIMDPAYGWVRASAIEGGMGHGYQAQRNFGAECSLLRRMYHTRRQYTGNSPVCLSAISSQKLFDTLTMYDEMFQILDKIGRGNCQVTHGGFLVDQTQRKWWPPGYEDWAHHSFLLFDDGSIADITADQFNSCLPQLWWPADLGRYCLNDAKADIADAARKRIGLQNWSYLTENDLSTPEGVRATCWWNHERGSFGLARHSPTSSIAPVRPQIGTGLQTEDRQDNPVFFRWGQPLTMPPVSRTVDVGRDRAPVRFRRLTSENELDVWFLEDLFCKEELSHLVQLCERRQGFARSLQTSMTGEQVQDGRRTSSSCAMLWPIMYGATLEEVLASNLPHETQEEIRAAQQISDVCSLAVGVERSCIEPLQFVKYAPGQFYRAHLDCHKEPDRISSRMGEQRTHTLLVFVSDVPPCDGGGYTHFPKLGLRILPRAGSAVLWKNVQANGLPDQESLHEGEATMKCEKIAMNCWIADRPFTKELVERGRERRGELVKIGLERRADAVSQNRPESFLLRKIRVWRAAGDASDDD